jgi:hypothetical protein
MDNNETLDEEFFSELPEDNEILELLDFALLEDDSAILQEDTDEYSSSPPIGSPVAVQATKKAETKPARSILETDLFIREIYIKAANTATHAKPLPPKELYCAKNEIG